MTGGVRAAQPLEAVEDFLLDVLKGDAAAHEALLPDAVQFLGIDHSTTLR